MYNSDPIQQTNLVSDDAAAAMNDIQDPVPQQTIEPTVVQPQTGQYDDDGSSYDSVSAPENTEDTATTEPTISEPVASEPSGPVMPSIPIDTSTPGVSEDVYTELDSIKKTALEELQPLIKHVEQSPEERFDTVMMMIRSNDDASLIAEAYEAAKGIEDEKTRATALLNIVSEIEYLKSKANG